MGNPRGPIGRKQKTRRRARPLVNDDEKTPRVRLGSGPFRIPGIRLVKKQRKRPVTKRGQRDKETQYEIAVRLALNHRRRDIFILKVNKKLGCRQTEFVNLL